MQIIEKFSKRLRFPADLKWYEWLLLAILVGGGITYITYHFGTGNHIEQLPIVMRFRDSEFLKNDFFVNESSGPGPRYFYALTLGNLSKIFPLEYLYFTLTMLANTAVAWITMKTSQVIFKQNVFTAALSAVLVFAVKPFNLGEDNYIYHSLVPAVLALPFSLTAIQKGLQGKAIWAAVFTGVASIFHPLLGFETGGIILLMLAIDWLRKNEWADVVKLHKIKELMISGLVLLGFGIFTVFPMMGGEKISNAKFIELLAYFRHPHHYIPSSFGWLDYLAALSFLTAIIIIVLNWKDRTEEDRMIADKVLVLIAILLILCVCGYVFVELIPIRIITTLQTFRMLYILKWLGAILIAGFLSELVSKKGDLIEKGKLINLLFMFAFSAWLIITISSDLISSAAFIFWSVVAALFLFACEGRRIVFGLLLISAIVIAGLPSDPLNIQALVGDSLEIGAQISLDELDSPTIDIARFAAENLPKDAIVMAPPDMGILRTIGERAIVVDFDSFPFGDSAMMEWESRLITCYGETSENGFAAAQDLKEKYRLLDDVDLEELHEVYGFDYAVIYKEKRTSFPILYSNDYFKLIEIDL